MNDPSNHQKQLCVWAFAILEFPRTKDNIIVWEWGQFWDRYYSSQELQVYARSSGQSCPLSPGISTLSLESLAFFIKKNKSQDINRITLKNVVHHISLYVDDILLYVENPSESMIHILQLQQTLM